MSDYFGGQFNATPTNPMQFDAQLYNILGGKGVLGGGTSGFADPSSLTVTSPTDNSVGYGAGGVGTAYYNPQRSIFAKYEKKLIDNPFAPGPIGIFVIIVVLAICIISVISLVGFLHFDTIFSRNF